MGRGYPQPTRDLAERSELRQQGAGQIPGPKRFLEFSKHVWTPLVAVFAVANVLSEIVY